MLGVKNSGRNYLDLVNKVFSREVVLILSDPSQQNFIEFDTCFIISSMAYSEDTARITVGVLQIHLYTFLSTAASFSQIFQIIYATDKNPVVSYYMGR